MFGVTSSDGSRRQLPQWMLGGSSAGQQRQSGGAGEKANLLQEPVASQDAETVIEKHGKRIQSSKKETEEERPYFLQKCVANKRKRKLTEQDEDFEGDDLEVVPEKKCEKKCSRRGRVKDNESLAQNRQDNAPGKGFHEKETLGKSSHVLAKCKTKRNKNKTNRQDADFDGNVLASRPKKSGRGRSKLQEPAVPKRQEVNDSSCGSGAELEVESLSDDDDVELTADDLLMIAEEYIRADQESKPSNHECGSSSSLALRRVASSNKSDDPMHSERFKEGSLIQDATSSRHTLSSASEKDVFSSSTTGDLAKDMLDLFLGPWLKKPVQKEARTDIVTDSLAFTYEFESQTHNNVNKEEIAPITKKKTSLKDKVTMLLD